MVTRVSKWKTTLRKCLVENLNNCRAWHIFDLNGEISKRIQTSADVAFGSICTWLIAREREKTGNLTPGNEFNLHQICDPFGSNQVYQLVLLNSGQCGRKIEQPGEMRLAGEEVRGKRGWFAERNRHRMRRQKNYSSILCLRRTLPKVRPFRKRDRQNYLSIPCLGVRYSGNNSRK